MQNDAADETHLRRRKARGGSFSSSSSSNPSKSVPSSASSSSTSASASASLYDASSASSLMSSVASPPVQLVSAYRMPPPPPSHLYHHHLHHQQLHQMPQLISAVPGGPMMMDDVGAMPPLTMEQQQQQFMLLQELHQHQLMMMQSAGPATAWGLPVPPVMGNRPLPPGPPLSPAPPTSAQSALLAPPPHFGNTTTTVAATAAPLRDERSSSVLSGAEDSEDGSHLHSSSSSPPSATMLSSGQLTRKKGGQRAHRTRCGLCGESWDETSNCGSNLSYPDCHNALIPKCPKCNKASYGGLCYAVESESRQGELTERRGSNGRTPARSLPHVIYQPVVSMTPAQHLTDTFVNVIRRGKAVLATLPGSTGDNNMYREYFLFPEKRSQLVERVELVEGLESLRDILTEDQFYALHYKYDSNAIMAPCLAKKLGGSVTTHGGNLDPEDVDIERSIQSSNIQLGLLIRRGTNKLYNQRVLGLSHQNTFNVRLDIFVPRQLWDRMGNEKLRQLKYIQQLVEDEFLLLFKQWNTTGVQREKEESQHKTSNTGSPPSSRLTAPDQVQIPHSPIVATASPLQQDEPSSPSADADSPSPPISSPLSSSILSSPSSCSAQISPYGKKRRYYPLCLIGQRDVFRIQLIPVSTTMMLTWNGSTRRVTKTQWYFPRGQAPENYNPRIFTYNPTNSKSSKSGKSKSKTSKSSESPSYGVDDDDQDYVDEISAADPDDETLPQAWNHHGNIELGYPVGITSYTGFFSESEMRRIEESADMTDADARNGKYDEVPNTYQSTHKGDRLCRTKFFFSARYLWTSDQMSSPDSTMAQGIRADVAEPPMWMRQLIERPLVENKIVKEAWVNEFAMNIYHDGTEGLGQHYDDKKRFKRPINSLRIFSDSRLAFGSKDFSMTNSVFFVPMPRGCITVLEKKGYAVDGIKHCIRAADMGGKSGVVLLRQIHPHLIKEAKTMQRNHSLTRWLSSLGLDDPQQYVQAFIDEELDMSSIRYLQECDLKTLGINKMGPRKIVLQAIYELRERDEITMPSHSCCGGELHSGGTSKPALKPRDTTSNTRQLPSTVGLSVEKTLPVTPSSSRPSKQSTSTRRSRSPGRDKTPSKEDTTKTSSQPATTVPSIYATPPPLKSRTTPRMMGRVKRNPNARPLSPPTESSPFSSPLSSPSFDDFGYAEPSILPPSSFSPSSLTPPSSLSTTPSSSLQLSSPTSPLLMPSYASPPGYPPQHTFASPPSSGFYPAGSYPPSPMGLLLPSGPNAHSSGHTTSGSSTLKRPLTGGDGVPFTVTPMALLPSSSGTPVPPTKKARKNDASAPTEDKGADKENRENGSEPEKPSRKERKKSRKEKKDRSSSRKDKSERRDKHDKKRKKHKKNKKTKSSSASSSAPSSSDPAATMLTSWKATRPLVPLQPMPRNVLSKPVYPGDVSYLNKAPGPMMTILPAPPASIMPPSPSTLVRAALPSASSSSPSWSPARLLENQLLTAPPAAPAQQAVRRPLQQLNPSA